MFEIGVAVRGHNDLLPLINVRNELVRVVLEAEEGVTVGIEVRLELVLDALPGSEVCGFLVAVLPDGAPGLEDGAGGGVDDLGGGGEAAVEEGADHEGVGFGVEGVELGGDVGFRGDEEGRRGRGFGGVVGLGCARGLGLGVGGVRWGVVGGGVGRRRVGGGRGRGEEEGEGGVVCGGGGGRGDLVVVREEEVFFLCFA